MTHQALLGVYHPSAPTCELQTVVRHHEENVEMVKGGLVEQGVPHGLAGVIAQDDSRIGLRIYLLDNSGSMTSPDGNVMRQVAGGSMQTTPCTRWEEICAFAEDHARYNLMVGTPCEFVLLNSLARQPGAPLVEGRDFVRIDRSAASGFAASESLQLQSLTNLLRHNSPRGVTPLSERLEEIMHRAKKEANFLRERGQMVFITIATDGLPTSSTSGHSNPSDQQQLMEQLRCLCRALPVQLVIRLCTDEEKIIEFYNRIDEELEFPLDILDDLASEAKEIAHANKNGWFAYSPLLHRVREAGTLCKVLDSIDEKTLNPQEVRYLAELLSGSTESLQDLSDREFIRKVRSLVCKSPLVYDAVSQKMQPILNISRLRAAMQIGLRGNLLHCFSAFW